MGFSVALMADSTSRWCRLFVNVRAFGGNAGEDGLPSFIWEVVLHSFLMREQEECYFKRIKSKEKEHFP
jgi:vacuolar-type H+-ATPase catalytic subunit A/Vma1